MVWASAVGERAPAIARRVARTAREAHASLDAFEAREAAACLRRRTSRPRTIQSAFPAAPPEALRALLHQSHRTFGTPTRLWTLDRTADVSFGRGLTATRVTGETMRAMLGRSGGKWQQA